MPAVVTVTVVLNDGRSDVPAPFKEFFREFSAPKRSPRRTASGVIVDPSGLALTNARLLEKAAEIEVTTSDGGRHNARIVGLDRAWDLAVIRLEAGTNDFRAARFGDSERARVGDWVVVIGAPFGLQGVVTVGILSAKARFSPATGQVIPDAFLQTDAAVNPGNERGPLINLDGDVIGTVAGSAQAGAGSVGIGFAVASNIAKRVYMEMIGGR